MDISQSDLKDMKVFWRFFMKVQASANGCWDWTAVRNKSGYGQFRVGQSMQQAHRYSYQFFVKKLPPYKPGSYELNHKCENRGCVNPHHLELILHRDNVLIGSGPTASNAKKTHCLRGHEYTPENTKVKSSGGKECRLCMRSAERVAASKASTRKYRSSEVGRAKSREDGRRYNERNREKRNAYAKAYRERKRREAVG